MKKNGFTLIELLAVIVIISIIAVITIAKVNDSIEESRKNIAKNSAYNYTKAVQQYVYHEAMNKNTVKLNGTYSVKNGKLRNYQIEFSGTNPTNGFLSYSNNDIVRGCISINGYASIFEGGEIVNVTKGTCDDYVPGYDMPEIVTEGDGLYASTTDEGRYIYRGANPNNYIWLDENGDEKQTSEELYRIISFESDGTIKVVRDEKITKKDGTTGGFEWDEFYARANDENTFCPPTHGCNVWGNQYNTLFNGTSLGDNFHYSYYENSEATTLTSGKEGTVKNESTLNKYLNEDWLNSTEISKYIENHKFNTGGIYIDYLLTGAYKGIIKEKEEESTLTWTGKIALMNITEFVEASTNPECTNVHQNYETASAPCKESNWTMTKTYDLWSISPHTSGSAAVWYVRSSGYFGMSSPSTTTNNVCPAFYLKSGITLTGEGTLTNPYIIENM